MSEAGDKFSTIEPGQRIVKSFEANRRAGPAAHSLAARSLEMTGENRDPIGKPEQPVQTLELSRRVAAAEVRAAHITDQQ